MFRDRRRGARSAWVAAAAVAALVASAARADDRVELEPLWSHDTGG